MPRLKKPNPVVGTYRCDDCDSVASVFMIEKSRRKGALYVRCGCGCDQRTGPHIQRRWRERMEARPGFEWVKAGKSEPPGGHPPPGKDQDWQPGEPAPKPDQDGTGTVPGSVQEPAPVRAGEPNQVQEPDQREKLRKALQEKMR